MFLFQCCSGGPCSVGVGVKLRFLNPMADSFVAVNANAIKTKNGEAPFLVSIAFAFTATFSFDRVCIHCHTSGNGVVVFCGAEVLM